MATDHELSAEIDAVLKEYAVLWDAQNPSGLIALWDQDEPEPFYLAEEQDEWRVGWEQLKDYWNPDGPSMMESIRMRFDGVQAKRIADDLVFASFWIRFDTKMVIMSDTIGTDTRASAVFRKKPEGWRLVTWAESPQSPILYVQKLYQQHANEGDKSPVAYVQKLYERNTHAGFTEFMETHARSRD